MSDDDRTPAEVAADAAMAARVMQITRAPLVFTALDVDLLEDSTIDERELGDLIIEAEETLRTLRELLNGAKRRLGEVLGRGTGRFLLVGSGHVIEPSWTGPTLRWHVDELLAALELAARKERLLDSITAEIESEAAAVRRVLGECGDFTRPRIRKVEEHLGPSARDDYAHSEGEGHAGIRIRKPEGRP
jgi:hypothetical protein